MSFILIYAIIQIEKSNLFKPMDTKMDLNEKLTNIIDEFNESEKNVRNHIQLGIHYYNRLAPLYDYPPNAKGEQTYNSPSSCLGYFFAKSNLAQKLEKEELQLVFQANFHELSDKKQTQFYEMLYQNHKDKLFHFATQFNFGNMLMQSLKNYPYDVMDNKDYIDFMNICLKTAENQLTNSNIKQTFLKIIGHKKINQEEFIKAYPKLEVEKTSYVELLEDPVEVLSIKLDLKKLFLFNLNKTFGYGKFLEVMESFFKQFEYDEKFINVIINYENNTEDHHYMSVVFCAKELNKPVWKKTMELHLEEILKQNKLNLAQEKLEYTHELYEKALLEYNLENENQPDKIKVKTKRNKI